MSRKILHDLGIACPEVYGDPGLLLPAYFPFEGEPRKGIGIISHYADYARACRELRRHEVRVIDIRSGINNVLKQANQCELLLSSSLHGCVIGDAYGIPTGWIRLSDKVVGNGFKFQDYYCGTDREPIVLDRRNSIDLDSGVRHASNMRPPVSDAQKLIHSFPFKRQGPYQKRVLFEMLDNSSPG